MSRSFTNRHSPAKPKGPNYNELARADQLCDSLARSVRAAAHIGLDRVSLPRSDAEELLQLLDDSLKTARQLRRESQA